MKNTLLTLVPFLFCWLLFSSCRNKPDKKKILPRIAITGLAIESSTFSVATTSEIAFHERYGDEVFSYFPFLSSPVSLLRKPAYYFPAVKGHALPGGVVTREAYESLLEKTLDSLQKKNCLTMVCFSIFTAP